MKKLLIIFSTIVLSNCNAIGGDEYEIKGTIKNNIHSSVYLERVSHSEIKMIDSSIIQNGNFQLKGPIENLGFYRIRVRANNPQGEVFWFVTLDKKEKIDATIDVSNPLIYKFKGSDYQTEFQNLITFFNSHQAESMQLYQQYNTFSQKDPNSKETQELAAQIQTKNDNFNKYITNVIQTSKNMMSKYYLYSVLLQQFQNQPVPEQLTQDIRAYSDKLNTDLPGSPYAADFKNIITNIDMQKKMSEAKSKLDVGAIAPDVEFVQADGKKVKLSSFRGKVVLMDFWASWCRPCRMENPNVVAAYKRFKDKGLIIASISQDSDLEKWKAAIAQDGLIWNTHFADKLGGSQASMLYDVSYIPKTYLIDKNGKIAAKDLRGPALDVELEKLLK